MKVENTLIRLDMEIKIWRTGLQDFIATYKIRTLSHICYIVGTIMVEGKICSNYIKMERSIRSSSGTILRREV